LRFGLFVLLILTYNMRHSVTQIVDIVNIMNQDVHLGVTWAITQAELKEFSLLGRVGESAVVYRVLRSQQGGGFGDQSKHPFTWGVIVYVDEYPACINSARGSHREWNSLDRLERWLREQKFRYWWVRNDLEPLGIAEEIEDENGHMSDGSEEPPYTAAPWLPDTSLWRED